jgi:hypothetical protein
MAIMTLKLEEVRYKIDREEFMTGEQEWVDNFIICKYLFLLRILEVIKCML